MRLTCYPTGELRAPLRPAPAEREWMDATPQQYAYRCLPLSVANAHGWEMLCPTGFEARWTGGTDRDAIKIEMDEDIGFRPASHFGSGIMTFHTGYLVETEPGYNLWVGGPVNRPMAGISPLTGVIETDWSPYSFTMNWVFTVAHMTVRFEAGDPFCSFFPVARGLLETLEPEIRDFAEAPEKRAQNSMWSASRKSFLTDLPKAGTDAHAQRWQKGYFRGRSPDGSTGAPDHQTKLRLKPFEDKTANEEES